MQGEGPEHAAAAPHGLCDGLQGRVVRCQTRALGAQMCEGHKKACLNRARVGPLEKRGMIKLGRKYRSISWIYRVDPMTSGSKKICGVE